MAHFLGLENPISKAIYGNFNNTMEKLTNVLNYISIKIVYPMISVPVLFVYFYRYVFMDLGRDSFQLLFRYWCVSAWTFQSKCVFRIESIRFEFSFLFFHRFPFDMKNPIGYLLAFILLYILHINLLYFATCAFVIGVGIYMLVISVTKDLKNIVITFRDCVKTEPNPLLLSKHLFDFIQFHSNVKGCVFNFLFRCHQNGVASAVSLTSSHSLSDFFTNLRPLLNRYSRFCFLETL